MIYVNITVWMGEGGGSVWRRVGVRVRRVRGGCGVWGEGVECGGEGVECGGEGVGGIYLTLVEVRLQG